MKIANVFLTKEEAQYGCKKLLTLPGQAAPLSLVLNPGTQDNTKLRIYNAQFYSTDGRIVTVPVEVFIHVKGGVSTVDRKKKSSHWFLKALGALLLIGIGVGIGTNSQRTQPKSGGGTVSMPNTILDILADNSQFAANNPGGDPVKSGGSAGAVTPNAENNVDSTGTSGTAAPNMQTGTNIPAVLLQKGWENFGSSEYCPKFEFFSDGTYRMWYNLGDEYGSFDATYEVYQYSDGSRAISCDFSALYLENCLWKRVYLVESSGGWKYQGASLGFTDSSCSFVKTDSSAVPVSVTSVQTPGVAAGSHWATDGVQDELTINWVDAGKVNFDFDVYRIYGFENQTGFCTPDGSVYCYLSVGEDSLDGLVRLTFQEQSISLEFLTAESGRSHYLGDYYVGNTYIFR